MAPELCPVLAALEMVTSLDMLTVLFTQPADARLARADTI